MSEFDRLVDDTAARLAAATQAIDEGQLVDLDGLLPVIEELCASALARGDRMAAERLIELVTLLDGLEHRLRTRIEVLSAPPPAPDPRRAASLYRAASPPTGER